MHERNAIQPRHQPNPQAVVSLASGDRPGCRTHLHRMGALLALQGIHSELSPQSLTQRRSPYQVVMNQLPMNQPTTIEIEPANNTQATFQRFVTSLLARLSVAAVILFLGIVLVRVGAAVFVHHRIANAGSDFARVSGLDSRMSFWLEGPASWTLAFALTSIFLRTIWLFAWPFGKSAHSLRVPLILFGLTGLGALVPSTIQKVRGVNADGLPVEMLEITEPGRQKWFAPDGTAMVFFSREADGALRFWNRPGLTPDRRVESQPVNSAIRVEWERAENARVEAKRREEAAREAARRQEETRQRLAMEEKRRAEQERMAAQRASEAQNAAEAQRSPDAVQPSVNTFDRSAHQSASRFEQPVPAAAQRAWARYRLIPGKVLRIDTGGRPCSVRTDTTMEVFPNNPGMPRRVVFANRGLRFPTLRGQGPRSIYARPLGITYGTIELRYDD